VWGSPGVSRPYRWGGSTAGAGDRSPAARSGVWALPLESPADGAAFGAPVRPPAAPLGCAGGPVGPESAEGPPFGFGTFRSAAGTPGRVPPPKPLSAFPLRASRLPPSGEGAETRPAGRGLGPPTLGVAAGPRRPPAAGCGGTPRGGFGAAAAWPPPPPSAHAPPQGLRVSGVRGCGGERGGGGLFPGTHGGHPSRFGGGAGRRRGSGRQRPLSDSTLWGQARHRPVRPPNAFAPFPPNPAQPRPTPPNPAQPRPTLAIGPPVQP
jgi:hypothetical protein